jgi:hypothetical protein
MTDPCLLTMRQRRQVQRLGSALLVVSGLLVWPVPLVKGGGVISRMEWPFTGRTGVTQAGGSRKKMQRLLPMWAVAQSTGGGNTESSCLPSELS